MSFLQKKQIVTKLFQYMGNKLVHLDLINELISQSNKETYIEPFLGSAQVLLNLKKQFKHYYVAEIDTNLLNIYNQLFNHIEKNEFTSYVNKIKTEWDANSYEGYYNFRNYFNKNLWKSNTKEECFSLIILMNNCINSMVRFGPNGFNASYGSRWVSNYKCISFENSLDKLSYLKDKITLTDNAFNLMNHSNSLYILDPPYQVRGMGLQNGWNIEYLQEMFFQLDFNSNDIIYFDIENEIGDKYFKNKIYLNKIKNISPSRKEEKILNEVCYYKIGENK